MFLSSRKLLRVFVCVCDVHVEAKGWHQVLSSIALHVPYQSRVSCLYPEFSNSASLDSQLLPGITCLHLRVRITGRPRPTCPPVMHLSAGISISAVMLAFWPWSHLPRPCFSDRVPLCCSNWPLTHYTISLALNLRIILSQLLECWDSRYEHHTWLSETCKLRRKTMREPTFMPTLTVQTVPHV